MDRPENDVRNEAPYEPGSPAREPDPGSPHVHPEDHRRLGIGDFDPNQGTAVAQPSGPDDAEVAEEVRRALSSHPLLEQARIEVSAGGGILLLGGLVPNRFARERAEELAREAAGGREVRNHIHIQHEPEEPGPVLTSREPGANNSGSTQRS